MKLRSLALILSLVALCACTPVGVASSVGAAAGGASVSEGGIPQALTDARIRAAVNDKWFRKDLEMFQKLNLSVNQGRVLVTGVVQKPEHRVEAIRLVWQIEGVKQVINEVKVANSDGIKGFVRDNWITGALKTKMLFDKDIQSVNYTTDTVQGVVYLMGVAQNMAELNKVVYHARNTDYVRDVVSHVRLLGQPVISEAPITTPNAAVVGGAKPQQNVQSPSSVQAQKLAPLPTKTVGTPPATPVGKAKPIVDKDF